MVEWSAPLKTGRVSWGGQHSSLETIGLENCVQTQLRKAVNDIEFQKLVSAALSGSYHT